MLSRDLKECENNSTRERILEAATYLISTEGHNLFSIRALARYLDMSATNIYNYYLNRDALLLDVFDQGYNLVLEYKKAAYSKGKNQIDGVKNVLWAIHDFSINNYHMYDILYIQSDVINIQQFYGTELEELAKRVMFSEGHSYNFWDRILKDILPNSSKDARKTITLQIGNMIHGAIRCYHVERFKERLKEPLDIVGATIQHIIDNLEQKSNWGII